MKPRNTGNEQICDLRFAICDLGNRKARDVGGDKPRNTRNTRKGEREEGRPLLPACTALKQQHGSRSAPGFFFRVFRVFRGCSSPKSQIANRKSKIPLLGSSFRVFRGFAFFRGFRFPKSQIANLKSKISPAFSLIETVGVLAIMAILAAALAPVVIRQIDRAALSKETTDMGAISNALVLATLRTKTLPDETTWSNVAADWLSRPSIQIGVTPRHFNRIFLVDDSGFLGNYPAGSPYTQDINGTGATGPASARVMLISTIANGPLPLASGRPGSTAFNDIWNTLPNAKPSSWSSWKGDGYDLVIERMDFQPLFHHLILVNRDYDQYPPGPDVSIDASTTTNPGLTTNGMGWNSWYLDGTVVGLDDTNAVPVTRYVLRQDMSYVFEDGAWRGYIGGNGGNDTLASDFDKLAHLFMSNAWYTGSHMGGNQFAAVTAMFTFMGAYTMWANECPEFWEHGASSAQNVPEYQCLDTIGAKNALLDTITGTGGLLK